MMRLMPRGVAKPAEIQKKRATRITVTIPRNDYEVVVQMAKAKRVSTAWVVRDAVEKYIAADVPLLAQLNTK